MAYSGAFLFRGGADSGECPNGEGSRDEGNQEVFPTTKRLLLVTRLEMQDDGNDPQRDRSVCAAYGLVGVLLLPA